MTGLGGKANAPLRETGFDIVTASEVMAILALSSNLQDLRDRLSKIVVGYKDDGTPRYKHTGKDGGPLQRPNEAQIQAINSALQAKEMGQKAMHEYMGKQLGLNIKRQEAGIVSSEFTKTLEHNASQLALETDKFESNEQLAQAETLGIFTAEDGTEQNTLSREELMARLTGQFGVTTTRHRLVDGEQQSYQHTKMEDTVEMQKLKADLTGRFKDAKGVCKTLLLNSSLKPQLEDTYRIRVLHLPENSLKNKSL